MFRKARNSSSGALTLFAASGLHTHICKPEAANTVRAPDDEWCAARNMLSLQ
jgi:hypothetical protein